jgi:hypothetical protein
VRKIDAMTEHFKPGDVRGPETDRGKTTRAWYQVWHGDRLLGSAWHANIVTTPPEELDSEHVRATLNTMVHEHGAEAVERDLAHRGGIGLEAGLGCRAGHTKGS